MIVVDTSAPMAILLGEPLADACQSALVGSSGLLISAATVVEARIVASRSNLAPQMGLLLSDLDFHVVGIAPEDISTIADAYRRWGKGFHPARLNFGDCFAYALARAQDCPLLFVGNDFRQTDIASALPHPAG